jgi:heme-degrading monooxygenase HmoA
MYAAVRRGKVKPGSADELARRVNEEALSIVSGVPGFQAYYVIYGEDDTVVTVSVFEDRAGAEECNKQIMAWIRENMGPMLVTPPEAMEGEVIVHKTG